MTTPGRSRSVPIILAALAGLSTAFVCVPLLGITSAIPAPPDLFPAAKAHGLLEPALLAWQTLVVAGPAVALPALIMLAMLCVAFPGRHGVLTVAFGLALAIGLDIAVPLAYFEPITLALDRQWWAFGTELAIALSLASIVAWGRVTARSSDARA